MESLPGLGRHDMTGHARGLVVRIALGIATLGLMLSVVEQDGRASASGAAARTAAWPRVLPRPAAAEVVVAPAPAPAPVAAPAPPPAPPGPKRLMLIGDSMAFTAAEGLANHAPAFGFTVANEGIFGCGVVRGGPYRHVGAQHDLDARCADWPSLWHAAVERVRPDVTGIVVGRWELMDRVFNGRWTNIGDPEFAAYIERELDEAITIAGSAGSRVAIFTTPYYRRGIRPDGGLHPEDDPARVDAVNALMRRVAERRPGTMLIDVGGWLSPGRQYTPEIGGRRVRSDGVHLTPYTGDVLAPWLFPQLQALASS